MRNLALRLALAAAAALALQLPASARPTPAPPSAIRSILHVQGAVTPDADFRTVDYGQLLMVQRVASGPGVRIGAKPKGPPGLALKAGALLAPVRFFGPHPMTGYCYNQDRIGGFSIWAMFCFIDTDQDGRFDKAYSMPGNLPFSRLAVYGPVREFKLGTPVPYEKVAEPGTGPEVMGLKLGAVTEGLVWEGHVVYGKLEVQVVMGYDAAHTSTVTTQTVALDRSGRGRFQTRMGHDVLIDRVAVDGRARVKVVAGPQVGETSL